MTKPRTLITYEESNPQASREHHLVAYDPVLRRVWVGGQRVHHGATGAAFAAVGVAGVAARRLPFREFFPVALFGALLMAHDWKDRYVWFERGSQQD